MERDPERDDYALIGHPVAHSLSPAIHEAFARQTGQNLRYLAIDVRDRFEPAVREFFRAGGRGMNVTIPHKGAAYTLTDEVSMGARVARAVNTLSLGPDCRLVGDNTDGPGLIHDLKDNLGIALVQLQRFEEAAPHYREALRHQPDFTDVHNAQAVMYYRMGDYDAAWEAVLRLRQVGGQPNPDFLEALGAAAPEPTGP